MKRDVVYLCIAVCLGLVGKWAYAHATVADLGWVLQPTSWLLQGFLGERFLPAGELGYVFPGHQITINRQCAGVNFMIVLGCASLATLPPRLSSSARQLRWVLALPLVAYLVTIVANTARILSLLLLQPIQARLPGELATYFHGGVGTVVYVTLLLLTYSLLVRLMDKPLFSTV